MYCLANRGGGNISQWTNRLLAISFLLTGLALRADVGTASRPLGKKKLEATPRKKKKKKAIKPGYANAQDESTGDL